MSLSIDYFFNYSKNSEELIEDLHDVVGIDLVPSVVTSSFYDGKLLGMPLVLGSHDLTNAGDIDFETYSYCLRLTTTAREASFRPHQVSTMAFLGYVLYKKLNITGILVFNREKLLSSYKERFDHSTGSRYLYDPVSQQAVCSQEHIDHILTKIPEEALTGTFEADISILNR
jgi:hypothetical protein